MRKLLFIGLLCCTVLGACNSDGKTDKKTDTKAKTEKPAAKAAEASTYESPLPKLAEIVQQCSKVEYLLYNYGMSFESPSPDEPKRVYTYFIDEPAKETNCKKDYDGSIIFKDAEGDIKLDFEFNIPRASNCNRAVFKIEGKEYRLPMNDTGLRFFDQVMDLRDQNDPNKQ